MLTYASDASRGYPDVPSIYTLPSNAECAGSSRKACRCYKDVYARRGLQNLY